ncbi:hypothetical protein NMG60_11004075 [Bertholletia excelsa]
MESLVGIVGSQEAKLDDIGIAYGGRSSIESLIGIEGNEEAKFDDITVTKTSCAPSSPREIADPVVYKLVRVDVDGRLVPATDDEVVEVEDLLEDEKSEICPAAGAEPSGELLAADDEGVEVGDLLEDDKGEICALAEVGQNIGLPVTDDEVVEVGDLLEDEKCEICPVVDVGSSIDRLPSDRDQFKSSKGQSEKTEPDAEMSNRQPDAEADLGRNAAQAEETVHSVSSGSCINQSATDGEWANPLDGPTEDRSSTLVVCASSKPDFSKLEGQICLDNLSVRELHETFKATFGRETSVKDKQWLKRRIAMGLANSCDVSTMTFFIKDNKVVIQDKEESSNTVDGCFVKDLAVRDVNENYGGSLIGCNNQVENPQIVACKRSRNSSVEYDCSNEDQHAAQRAAKRVRKPTKRYIEELSEIESREYSGKIMSSVKNSGQGQPSPRSRVRPVQDVRVDGRPIATRQDSLGGSDIEVPYVCRVRRSRPRENFVALMKLQPSGMGMAAKLVKKALRVCGPRQDNNIGNKIFEARPASGWTQKPHINEPANDKHYQGINESELEKEFEPGSVDSAVNSDDYTMTVPTAKGGIRRKHHRPWTLSEVVKLVEGVARYGAGRWSEIKRLAFASYSYRTSVDLKDKWRNLLRASFAQSPAEKAVQNSRKPASVPIPAPILLRVRELAEMQTQVAPNLTSKFNAASDRNVNETTSGYL